MSPESQRLKLVSVFLPYGHLLTPNALNRLKHEIDDLVIDKDQLEQKIKELEQEIEVATVIMDGNPSGVKSVDAKWMLSRRVEDLLFG